MDYCRYVLDCLIGNYRTEASANIYGGLLMGSTFTFSLWDRIDNGDLRFLFPFVMVGLLWALDMVTGLWCAWERHDISPEKLARSFRKLLLYAFVMGLGIVLDKFGSHYPILGLNTMSPLYWLINSAILLTEASSILRNAGDLSDNPRLKKLLERFADKADDQMSQLLANQEKLKEKVDGVVSAAAVVAQAATAVAETAAKANQATLTVNKKLEEIGVKMADDPKLGEE